jgi:uncharacterized protein (TIGR02246 family)
MPRPRSSKLFPTADEAEGAFYDAFERGDIAAMMAVWNASDDIVCVHPQGPRLVGFDAVRESWVQIFASGMLLRVRTTESRQFNGQTLAVHTVIENLAPAGEQTQATTAMCATNVYELTENGWRMVVHHASPMPEATPVEEPAPPPHTLH